MNSQSMDMTTSTPPNGPGDPLSKLTRISAEVYFLADNDTKPGRDSPSAILLFAWMGAPLRHMAKFLGHYSNTLFPGSPIILILSPSNQFMASDTRRQEIMRPAYTTFLSLDVTPATTLLHTFSNGGINALRTFVSLTTDNQFAARSLVVDSAPGVSTLRSALNAFTVDITHWWMRKWVSLVVFVLYVCTRSWEWVRGRDSRTTVLRRFLTGSGAVPETTRRLYLYSDGDELVQKESVEAHIRDMKEMRYFVRSRNFGGTRHVGHMRAHPELYWDEVQRIWSNQDSNK
jgi:Eukaryotic protein of unknown function (DUF829)